MARVHQYIPQAGEIAYIDSTSSLDRYNLSMFVISTSNSGGGLPLGVLITSDEKASTLAGVEEQVRQTRQLPDQN